MKNFESIKQFYLKYLKLEEEINDSILIEDMALKYFESNFINENDVMKIHLAKGLFSDLVYSSGEKYTWLLNFKNQYNNQALCDYIAFVFMNLFSIGVAKYNDKQSYITGFHTQGFQLLILMATHNIEMADLCYSHLKKNVMDGVLTRTVRRNKNADIPPKKLGVLGYGMLASIHNETFDWDAAQIPYDRLYTDFVRDSLYSGDETLVAEGILSLLNSHIKWASRSLDIESEVHFLGYEYDEDYALLWPFEYQAIKNIRAQRGLTTPVVAHPLCEGPLATTDHRPDFSRWQARNGFSQ
ncbi:hypothetical protein [Budvicia aquatica]|uniref:Uncharacterized protein n=1 Tax=Budvicia aquatica TaxID=82979 RepID=A0A484ZX48_9GAMM|nr:hypothetical protein [Budvicia aquatica]VFS52491.1 Uncharacterised protein [Budvicia aquatica]